MAKSILLSGFDAFEGKKENNSQIIAKALQQKFIGSDIKIEYCQLRTVYNKSSETLKDCFHALKEKPDYVISIGEGFCNRISFETVAYNIMNSKDPDNDGVIFQNERIRPDAPGKINFSLNLSKIRQSLSRKERRYVKMSHKIGTYVCNNLAYIMASDLAEAPYTFVHVPSYNCQNQQANQQKVLDILSHTISKLFR